MRTLLTAIVALTLLACGTAEARTAHFEVTLTGSYSTSGTATETGCSSVDADDNVHPLPPQTGSAGETVSFASTRPVAFVVSSLFRRPPLVGPLRLHRLIPVRVTAKRTSTLGDHGTVRGCQPGDDVGAPTADCGVKRRTYSTTVFGSTARPLFGYHFVNYDASTLWRPPDPFKACWLSIAQQWYGGARTHATAKVSATKLFNPHVRRIVLPGRRSGSGKRTEGNLSATAKFSERYTLTLTRIP
jgi:hypothetical protein